MERVAFPLWSAVMIICSLVQISCDSEASRIGSDFFNNPSLDVSSIDTVSVRLSTTKFDSLAVTGAARTLLGSFNDARLGRITASTCFLPALTGTSALDDTGIAFEKMSVVLRYEGYSYYDTIDAMTVSVHQLVNEMETAIDGNLYNTARFSLEETPLGSLTFIPRPAQGDSIEVFLDKTYAEDFFNKAKEQHQDFEDNDRFQKYVKGFAIVPDTSASSPIIGFEAMAELRLYYLDRNVVPAESKYISYSTENGLVSFMISANRSDTKLSDLDGSGSRLPAAWSDNEAYLQAGAGLAMRVDLPHLRELKQYANFYMTKAVLQIQPVHKSYGNFMPLPLSLDVHLVNYKNLSLGEYSSDARLIEDPHLERDTYYEIDATAFVKSQMEMAEVNENALLLLLPAEDFRSGADRVYFADAATSYTTRLIIYYATIMQ